LMLICIPSRFAAVCGWLTNFTQSAGKSMGRTDGSPPTTRPTPRNR
jgi:hypothetical protein